MTTRNTGNCWNGWMNGSKKIAAKLTPEDQQLLEDYEGSWLAQLCRQEEIIFSEGLMEGMMFGYWVALVGGGVEKIKV